MTRIIGPTGSRRRRRFLFVPILCTAALGLFWISGAQAVHDLNVFQLDGNAVTDPSPATGDDWDRVCHQVAGSDCSTSSDTSGATAVSWSNDCNHTQPNPATCIANDPTKTSDRSASTFAGGGSKDPQNIDQWAWNDGTGGLPDKDNLVHAYSARYQITGDGTGDCGVGVQCSLLYFGLDRFDNSGDAQTGFWFLQNSCGEGTNSVPSGTGFACTGDPTPNSDPSDDFHRLGDLLILSDFSIGGTTSTINIYQWNPACTKAGQVLGPGRTCGDANLEFLKGAANAKCTSGLSGDDFCGLVNPSTTTLPWSFKDKSNTLNNGALNGEFYEAGVNLTPLGLGGECFATVVAETRSSTSTTATLKDFIATSFGKCESGTVTTPKSGGNSIGNTSTTIPANGVLPVNDDAKVTVGGVSGAWSGNVAFRLCGPTSLTNPPTYTACASGGGTSVGSTPISGSGSTPVTVTSPNAFVTSVGSYCWRADFTVTSPSSLPGSSDSTVPDECFTVTPRGAILSTDAGAGPIDVGTAITDTAHLSNTANEPTNPIIQVGGSGTSGLPAGGSITFKLYSVSGSTCTNVAAATQTVPVSGDADYTASFTPASAGTYTWTASYIGDPPNTTGVTETGCPDASGREVVVVNQPTSISTAQTWLPQDTATVSPASVTGKVTFTLYASADCTGNPVNTFEDTSAPYATNNTTTYMTPGTTISWRATFTPDAGQSATGSTSHCERSDLTINDDTGS